MANVTFTRSTSTDEPSITEGLITFNTTKKTIYLSDGTTYYQCGAGSADALLNRGWIQIPESLQNYKTFISSNNTACSSAKNQATEWLVELSDVPYNVLFPDATIVGSSSELVYVSRFPLTRCGNRSNPSFIGYTGQPIQVIASKVAILVNLELNTQFCASSIRYYALDKNVMEYSPTDLSDYINILAYRY